MNTAGFTSLRASENVTLDQATDIVQQIIVAKIDQGKPVALFANETGSSSNYMCPATKGQANGSALWVDTSQDLATLGIDPANDRVYFQVWIEAKQHYCCVGDVIREMANNGGNIALAVE